MKHHIIKNNHVFDVHILKDDNGAEYVYLDLEYEGWDIYPEETETILWVFFRAVASAELLASDLEDFQTAREKVDELLKSKNPSSVEDVVSIVDSYLMESCHAV